MYNENDLVSIAKRENNKKRNYLVVNKLQGKHIPVNPCKALDLFVELAEMIKNKYENENLLIIGFAETATAIGSAVASTLGAMYMQTTRERVENVEFLFFSEEHSHATEQKLIKTDIAAVIEKTDRIVFVEDEVTTGNTILNIIRVIRETFNTNIDFSVLSLINGMDKESEERYKSLGIPTHYILKTDNSRYIPVAEKFSGNGDYYSPDERPCAHSGIFTLKGYPLNARRLINGTEYKESCEKLAERIISEISFNENEEILVIGTEEFMYPAIYTGGRIAGKGCKVFTHSTTRSPITVSKEEDYPLHSRYELCSLYDEERRTFIYNLRRYDKVVIITDSPDPSEKALNVLVNAAAKQGNDRIYIFKCEN